VELAPDAFVVSWLLFTRLVLLIVAGEVFVSVAAVVHNANDNRRIQGMSNFNIDIFVSIPRYVNVHCDCKLRFLCEVVFALKIAIVVSLVCGLDRCDGTIVSSWDRSIRGVPLCLSEEEEWCRRDALHS